MSFGPPRRQPKPTKPQFTIPREFNFETSKLAERKSGLKDAVPSSPFVPLVKKLEAFHSKARSSSQNSKEPQQMKSTIPVTPNLATSGLKKRPRVLSSAEIEDLKMAKLESEPFKALPIKRGLGVRPVESAPLTQVEEFNLSTARKKSVSSPERTQFKALPYDAKAFDRPVKSMSSARELTVPETPKLSFKRYRLKEAEKREKSERLRKIQESEESEQFKALPMPDLLSKPLEIKPPIVTEPKPFNLHTEHRGAKHQEAHLGMIHEEKERAKAAAQFRAINMPIGEPKVIQPLAVEPTSPHPFNLISVQKHHKHQRELDMEIQEQFSREKQAMNFRARDLPSPSNVFQLVKPVFSGTEQEPFNLASDLRAEKRQEFDQSVEAKAELIQAEKENLLLHEQELEKHEILELRKAMEFKAEPIKTGKPIHVQRSKKKLTEPKTPAFQTTKRARRR